MCILRRQGHCCRGGKIHEAGTTGSWTQIDTGRTSAGKYTHFRYNLAGTDYIVWADGANRATKYDGTTVTDLNATNAPSDPQFVTGFKDALFFAGMSSTPQELVFTAPFTDDDFTPANGAGSIKVDSDITGLFPFRDQLYIFCQERIFRLQGNTIADFVLQPVTRESWMCQWIYNSGIWGRYRVLGSRWTQNSCRY